METKHYFKCPVCSKRVLKSKGQMLMWTRICKDCYNRAQDSYYNIRQQSESANKL